MRPPAAGATVLSQLGIRDLVADPPWKFGDRLPGEGERPDPVGEVVALRSMRWRAKRRARFRRLVQTQQRLSHVFPV